MGETEDYLLNGSAGELALRLSGRATSELAAEDNGLSTQALQNQWVMEWSWGLTNLGNITAASPPFKVEIDGIDAGQLVDHTSGPGIEVEQNGDKISYTIDPATANLADLEDMRFITYQHHQTDLEFLSLSAQSKVIVDNQIKSTVDATLEAGPPAPLMAFVGPNGATRTSGATCLDVINVVGRAAPGATVKVWEGSDLLHTTTAVGDGHWSGNINLSQGFHRLYATQEIDGRTSPGSNIIAILIGLLTSQPDLSSLRLTDGAGHTFLPKIDDEVLLYLKPGETYTLSVAGCGNDPTLQMIFDSEALGTIILTDPDDDGVYEGNFFSDGTSNTIGFTLSAVTSSSEVIIQGEIRNSNFYKTILQDAASGQPLPNSTVNIVSPRDAASGLATGKRFSTLWPGELFGQANPQTTDSDGGFSQFLLPDGSYQFLVTQPGYQPLRTYEVPVLGGLLSSPLGLSQTITDPAEVTITIDETGFQPAVLTVAPGTIVEWQNISLDDHGTQGDFWDSGALSGGGSFKQRFDTAGTYPYTDSANPFNTATIIVGDSGSQHQIYLPLVTK
jgi:plastocyanin